MRSYAFTLTSLGASNPKYRLKPMRKTPFCFIIKILSLVKGFREVWKYPCGSISIEKRHFSEGWNTFILWDSIPQEWVIFIMLSKGTKFFDTHKSFPFTFLTEPATTTIYWTLSIRKQSTYVTRKKPESSKKRKIPVRCPRPELRCWWQAGLLCIHLWISSNWTPIGYTLCWTRQNNPRKLWLKRGQV